MTVASATPGPNKVPKAGSDNKLDPGWLPDTTETAADVSFDPSGTATPLASTDVQAAIVELEALVDSLSSTAAGTSYDPSGSTTPLISTDVQAAIDEIDANNVALIGALGTAAYANTGDFDVAGAAAAAQAASQPLSSNLTTYAGIMPSANVQSVLGAADYAAIRTLLALVIGTNVQAWDADLDTWAGKTAPSGTVLGTTDTQTLTNKHVTKRVVTLTDAATVTINADTTDVGLLTSLSQTTLFDDTTGTPTAEQTLVIKVKSTSAQTVTFGATFRASTNITLPTATTGSSKTDRWVFMRNFEDTKWDICAADSWT